MFLPSLILRLCISKTCPQDWYKILFLIYALFSFFIFILLSCLYVSFSFCHSSSLYFSYKYVLYLVSTVSSNIIFFYILLHLLCISPSSFFIRRLLNTHGIPSLLWFFFFFNIYFLFTFNTAFSMFVFLFLNTCFYMDVSFHQIIVFFSNWIHCAEL